MWSDPVAERGILSGLFKYGVDAYHDVSILLQPESFTVDSNAVIYKCLVEVLEDDRKPDIPSIYSTASEIGYRGFFDKKSEAEHLQAIISLPVELPTVRKFAAKIRKLQIAKLLSYQLGKSQDNLLKVTGVESISHILGLAEEAVYDFTSLINDDSHTKRLGDSASDYIQHLAENPVEQIGISTGFPIFDKSIGGGLRTGVAIGAARPKIGKSVIAANIGCKIAKDGIPVLNLDTEMLKEEQVCRAIAMMTEVSIDKIETGQFSSTPHEYQKVTQGAKDLENIPYYHESISGTPLEDQLGLMRRWITKEVGLNSDGTAKPCVIIYDYLKLMDSKDISSSLQEHQLLGFLLTALQNFGLKYKVPIFALMQLNRDGINKEGTEVASGSDRLTWFCTSFSILKKKSDEEIAEDGPDAGNRKLVPIISRFGAGLEYGDYINCHMKGWCAKITEGKTKLELQQSTDSDTGFETDDDEDQQAF